MMHLKTGLTISALVVSFAVPAAAQERLSKDQLLQLAVEREVCKGDLVPVDALYESDERVAITCGTATGFVPLAGGLGSLGAAGAAAAGLALVAGGGGTDGTTSTTSTN
ncbi:hypothetical protein [Pseudogemmobacter humi]|uniref:Porin n=1 Tax=Pseudogemmobacter humi TaxID=2483812 RepID=A0A3P5XSX5_9RHOB|nr:hypothetical protein [Pseudogemmobacter humi]VDC33916.1 hypothetical protein XINFAN_04120 [Pseudogemmobacter humi]